MLTDVLVKMFVATPDDISSPVARKQVGVLEGWVSVVANTVVGFAKLVPGVMIGSVAVIADAIHSFSDVASSAVVIWGFRAAAKPSDRKHPFGHGRAESIASLVIAVLLLVAALEFGKSAVTRILDPRPVTASPVLLAVLAATMVVKEWLARFSFALGRRIRSTALHADGWHHRSDALSTVVVIVALVGARFGHGWLDGAAGLVVAAFLAWAGIELVRESVDPLIGEAPSAELVGQIRSTAMSVDGVDKVHDVIVHRYGELIVTSLHVEVDAAISPVRSHEIAEEVQARLTAQLPGWATVHVDPVDRAHPLFGEIERFLAGESARRPQFEGFHDLRIVGRETPCYVILDITTEPGDDDGLAEILDEAIRARFPGVAKVVVNVEPRYVY